MRIKSGPSSGAALLVCAAVLLGGCGDRPVASGPETVSEAFIDAFYSWDPDRLAAIVVPGTDADKVLYYQGWAQAAHYQVTERRPCRTSGGHVTCAITVVDDFGTALGYTATDTFTLTVANGLVDSVAFAGDDPPVFEAVFDWIAATRPEVLAGPCRNMFAGGTTPAECARAVAQAARDFVAQKR